MDEKFKCIIKQINAHPAVKEINQIEGTISSWSITAIFEVSLPSNCRASGVSRSGVHLYEPVTLQFSNNYPFKAPLIKLRKDFNRDLPHLNPKDSDEFVLPCVYDGDLTDLLHQGEGLNPILDQISEWLKKAASNTLIEPSQGWEPIRRDTLNHLIFFDLRSFRNLISKKVGSVFLLCDYIHYADFFSGKIENYKPQFCNIKFFKKNLFYKENGAQESGRSISLFAWPDSSKVSSNYFPENIRNLGELIARANDYGCTTFGEQLNLLYYELRKLNPKIEKLFVILCARRPYNLIGDESNLELIPYFIHLSTKQFDQLNLDSKVESVIHLHSKSPILFRKLSFGYDFNVNYGVAQIGCGSLGSKISLHLARAGHGPFWLYDKDFFLPHNLARHSLYYDGDWVPQYKADCLKKAISDLGQYAEAFHKDVIEHIITEGLPKTASIIIDSSASISVREFLMTLSEKKAPGKIVHTALYNSGKMGLMLIEGIKRNPRVDDLLVAFWDKSLEESSISKQLTTEESGFSRRSIGQGCGSYTMVMTDSRLSIYSAGMAERINDLFKEGDLNKGEICFGLLSENNMGVTWHREILEEAIILKESGWEIRILKKAAATIHEESQQTRKETGGILIGHIFPNRKCAVISRTLPPPPDSIFSDSHFILGTQGLKEQVRTIQDKSGRLLTYIGTWHSHPMGGGPSSQDLETLEKMRKLRLGAPTINLIYAPSKIFTFIDNGDF